MACTNNYLDSLVGSLMTDSAEKSCPNTKKLFSYLKNCSQNICVKPNKPDSYGLIL